MIKHSLIGIILCLSAICVFEISLQPAFAVVVPDPPSLASLQRGGATQNDLIWTAPTNNGGAQILGYYITRSIDGGATWIEEPFSSTPQSYWKFDGSSTITDYGSYGNSLTYGGGGSPIYTNPTVSGSVQMVNSYIKLDGTHYLTNSDSRYNIAATGQQFSISFWMQASSADIGTNNVALITKVHSGAFIGQGWSVWIGGWGTGSSLATLNFNLMDFSGHYIRAYGYPSILDNGPHHIVVTYSGSGSPSGITIYVDNAVLSTYFNSDTVSGTTSVSDPLTVGAIATTNSNGLKGALDDIRVFTGSALTQQQVTDIYSVKTRMEMRAAPNVVWPAGSAANPNAFAFSDTNAIAGASSCYKVFAVNSAGQSTGSTQLCTAGNVPPDSPTGLTITNAPGGGETLTWNAPTNTGTSPLAGYYIVRIPATGGGATEQPFSSSPTSYWKFDGTISGLKDYGSLANDLSKGGTGTLSYGVLGAPAPSLGGALSLDSNTWLTVPTGVDYNFDIKDPFSVSFWMQASSADIGTGNWPIITKVQSGSFTGQGWSVWIGGWGAGSSLASLNFNLDFDDGNLARVIAYPSILDNKPHHIVVTYSGNNANADGMKIFVDGAQQSSTILSRYTTPGSPQNTIPLTIGGLSTNTGNIARFKGLLDEIRIFNIDLTPTPNNPNTITDLFSFHMISSSPITDGSGSAGTMYTVYAVNTDAGEGARSAVASVTGLPTPIITLEPSSAATSGIYADHGIFVSINDPSADLKKTSPDVIKATITDTSTLPPNSMDIPLTESGPSTHIFDNSKNLLLFSSSVDNNPSIPSLRTRSGMSDTIKVSYPRATDATFSIKPLPTGTPTGGTALGSISTVDCSADPINPGSMLSDGLCSSWVDQTQPNHANKMIVRVNVGGTWTEYDYACGSPGGDPCPSTSTNDIYVEYDWMAGHEPDQSAINAVVAAFASHGIVLHMIRDEEIPYHDNVTPVHDDGSADLSYDKLKSIYFGTPTERSTLTAAQLTAKSYAFHYALFVHSIKGASWSGDAGYLGPDIIISLGSTPTIVGSPDQQAGTLMHELGHNLGLRHGGSDDINCKPNYLSVMSYTRQFSDFIYNRNLDYSGSQLSHLDERTTGNSGTGLNEGIGIGNAAIQGLKTTVGGLSGGIPYTPIISWTNGSPINYNRAGTSSEILFGQNIHYFTTVCPDSNLYDLLGFNDWGGLQYRYASSSTYTSGVPSPDNTSNDKEITEKISKQIRSDRINMIEKEVSKLP